MDEKDLAKRHEFNVVIPYTNIPTNPSNKDRPSQLKSNYLVHATTVDSLDGILTDGLKPKTETHCKIWSDAKVSKSKKNFPLVKDVLQCRRESVYFWDDRNEGIRQSLATVGYLKKGNPAIIVTKTDDLKLESDPEMPSVDKYTAESVRHEGAVPKENTECFCTLSKEKTPDVGELMCPMMHKAKDCEPWTSPPGNNMNYALNVLLYDKLTKPESWECFCKKHPK